MKLGLAVRNTGPDAAQSVRDLPVVAEELGYHSVWFTDHVVGVRAMERFGLYGDEWLEMLTCLSYAAAVTTKVRLGTGILVVAHRNPVYAAKVVAAIDVLSHGRVDVGVGVGGYRDEFAALGTGSLYDGRGAITNEGLDLMLRCWEGGNFSWPDGHFAFERPIGCAPMPFQRPHPPLYVAGHSAPALRRAARYADVWHPVGAGKASSTFPLKTMASPEDVVELGDRLDQRAGRPIPRSIRLVMPAEGDFEGEIEAYREAGCTEVVIDIVTESFEVIVERATSLAVLTTDGSAARIGDI